MAAERKSPISRTALQRWVSRNLSETTAFVAHVNRLTSTPAGTDRLLMTIAYSLQLLTPTLSRLSYLLSIKLPTPIPLLLLTPTATALASTSSRLAALSSLISDVRIFMRLWGLFGIYQWGVSALRSPNGDKPTQRVVLAQVAVNACFQVLENIAYLSSHGIVNITKRTEAKFWFWSSRFWAAHVALEFWRLERERQLRLHKRMSGLSAKPREVDEMEEEEWRREWMVNAAYAPLTVHWSVPGGAIPQTAVGVLGTLAGVIGLRKKWRECA